VATETSVDLHTNASLQGALDGRSSHDDVRVNPEARRLLIAAKSLPSPPQATSVKTASPRLPFSHMVQRFSGTKSGDKTRRFAPLTMVMLELDIHLLEAMYVGPLSDGRW